MSDKKTPSRRDFLKGSTAMAAGAAVAGSLSIARSAHAQGSESIKVALIGSGGRGTGAAAQQMNADKSVRLVAIADAFENRGRGALGSLKNKYADQVDVPDDRFFTGLTAYKKALETDCDLVILATPPGFRAIQYEAAIEAGKHVFMEKPCCVDAPGYLKLMKASKLADEKNLLVGVGLQRRHENRYIENIKKIHDGAIGDVILSRVYWNGGGIWNRGREASMSEIQYQVHNWYHFAWLSGDNIGEQHIHNLDIGNWIQGDEHPVEANGMGGCTARYLANNKGTGQIFDHHFVEFTYANGAKMYSQCRHMRGAWGNVSEAVHGTSGTSSCSGRISGENEWRFQGSSPGGHQQEQIDLIAALLTGKRYNEGYYGANSSMTAVMGRMANYTGQLVKWDDLVAKGKTEMPEGDINWYTPAPFEKDENGDYPIPTPGVYKYT